MTKDELLAALDYNPCVRFGLSPYDPNVAYVSVLSRVVHGDAHGELGLSKPRVAVRVHGHDGKSTERFALLDHLVSAEEYERRRAYEQERLLEEQRRAELAQAIERDWILGPLSEASRAAAGTAVRPATVWNVSDCSFSTRGAAYRHLARHLVPRALQARRFPLPRRLLPKGTVTKIARLLELWDARFGLDIESIGRARAIGTDTPPAN